MNLTIEQIYNEPAGEVMDTWIAEYAMVWMVHPTLHPLIFSKGNDEIVTRELTSFGSFMPSEDIATAFQVLDMLDPKEWDIQISRDTEDEGKTWDVGLYRYSEDDALEAGHAIANTLPLAICQARLLARLHQVAKAVK